MRRMIDGRVGKIPATLVRRRNILVEPFLRVVGPDLVPVCFRESGERQDRSSRPAEALRSVDEPHVVEMVDDAAMLGPTDFGSGCAKIVRTIVATIDSDASGTLVNRLRR